MTPSSLTTIVSLLIFSLICSSNNFTSSAASINYSTPSPNSTPHRYRILAARDLSRYHNTISRHSNIKTTASQSGSPPPTPPPTSSREQIFPTKTNRRAALDSYHTTTSYTPSYDSVSYQTGLTSIKLPLYSAADFGVGEYLTELRLGTPARTVKLIVDTGSDLTWVKCRYHHHKQSYPPHDDDVFFKAKKSSSFKTVPCGSNKCSKDLADMFSLTTCPNPSSSPCLYNYNYQGLSASGVFGEETSTFPLTTTNDYNNLRTVRIRNIIGCTTESTQGGNLLQAADGVLGLSYHNHSLGYNAATKYGGRKFSYCLVDHLSTTNIRSHLIFGERQSPATINARPLRKTNLILGEIGGFYGVSVKGISVNGVMLSIPRQVWDVKSGSGGVIIDSGTSLTVLAQPAYKKVMMAVEQAMSGRFPNLRSMMDIEPFGYCFNSTKGYNDAMAPRLIVHFDDGARFSPHVKSYLIDDRPGVKCVGILEGGRGEVSVLGNILQQNYVWEFDLAARKLGFGPSVCEY